MGNTDQKINDGYVNSMRVSAACLVLCALLALVLGFLAKLPSSVTQLFRPAFIAACLISLNNSRYYRFDATGYHIVNLVYYTCILFAFDITSTTVSTYVSMALYIAFFVLASNKVWTKKEIRLILIAVTVACTAQSIITLVCNPSMNTGSGSSHITFLGATINRNTIAFAAVPGALCGLVLLLYDKSGVTTVKGAFYIFCSLACAIAVFQIACRSAFLATVGGVVCILWQKTRDGDNSREKTKRKIFTLILMLAAFLLVMYAAKDTMSSRLFDFGGDSNDSGRDILWEEAWELIDEKPIFGGGFDYWAATGHTMGTHNSFLTIMVSSGWVGGILISLFFLMALIEIMKTRNLIPLAFMAEVLLHSWTEPGMDYFAYIPLTLAFIITRFLQYQNKDLSLIFK